MASTTLPGWGAVDAGTGTGLSKAQVKADTLQAIRSGSIIATGELGTTVRGATPAAMPTAAMDREQGRQAMATPMRHGQMMAGGDVTTRLY